MSKKTKDKNIEFAVTNESDGNVHVRPVVDGEIIDTPVEEVINPNEPETTETDVEVRTEETITVVEPIATEEKPKSKEKYNKNIDFEGRGFSSFEEAVKFIETKYFKGLGKEDQEEYLNWLKN